MQKVMKRSWIKIVGTYALHTPLNQSFLVVLVKRYMRGYGCSETHREMNIFAAAHQSLFSCENFQTDMGG